MYTHMYMYVYMYLKHCQNPILNKTPVGSIIREPRATN